GSDDTGDRPTRSTRRTFLSASAAATAATAATVAAAEADRKVRRVDLVGRSPVSSDPIPASSPSMVVSVHIAGRGCSVAFTRTG
ncbi:hypothetical protein DKT68_15965, partial [Micromonospora acroterricola]